MGWLGLPGICWRSATRIIAAAALWLAVAPVAAVVIEAASGTLDATGTTTSAAVGLPGSATSGWEATGLEAVLPEPAPPTPLLDPLPANTNVLVTASFSAMTVSGNGQVGEWEIRALNAADNARWTPRPSCSAT